MCFNLHGIFCVHLADASAACCKVVAVAAPRVVGHCIGNASGHRVIMDVAQYAQKISYRCDRLTLVAILKQCTYPLILAVIICCITDAQAFHPGFRRLNAGFGCAYQQMCMVAHQAIRQDLKFIGLREFKEMKKLYIVRVIIEYLHFIDAANHHMVDAACRHPAWSTRHCYHLPAEYTTDFE